MAADATRAAEERVTEIAARLSAISPGQWRVAVVEEQTQSATWGQDEGEAWREPHRSNARFCASVRLDALHEGQPVNILPVVNVGLAYQANAEFIANAPSDIAWLLEQFRAQRGTSPINSGEAEE